MRTEDRTPAEVLALFAMIDFKPMSPSLRDGFAGCESENPLYGEIAYGAGRYTIVILDGDKIWVQDISEESDAPDEGRTYTLGEAF